VLFVSHNMSTIQSLCSRCIMLQAGQILADHESGFVIQKYLQNSPTNSSFVRPPQKNGKPTIVSGKIISSAEFENEKIQIDLQISTELACHVGVCLRLCDGMGHRLGYGDLGETRPDQLIKLNSGLNLIKFTLPINNLALGQYYFSLDISVPWVEFYDRVENCLFFEVVRPVKNNAVHVLSQSWGFGSVEFPLNLV
jgi:lipopolysaccharide transport system ATP-binding protein